MIRNGRALLTGQQNTILLKMPTTQYRLENAVFRVRNKADRPSRQRLFFHQYRSTYTIKHLSVPKLHDTLHTAMWVSHRHFLSAFSTSMALLGRMMRMADTSTSDSGTSKAQRGTLVVLPVSRCKLCMLDAGNCHTSIGRRRVAFASAARKHSTASFGCISCMHI